MNIQQCVSINNALTTIDNSLTSTLKTVNKLCGHFKDFEEQKDIVTNAYVSIDDARKKLADLRNIELSIKMNDSEIIQRLMNSNEWGDRCALVHLGINLDELKNDTCSYVRAAVAKHGLYLDEFKDDQSWIVRREVASQGAYLDELKDDDDIDVKNEALKKIAELKKQEKGSAGC